MEAVVLVGLQGAGKSSFVKDRLFQTHVRISLDLLRTRSRERGLLAWCLSTGQRFVVDNTNPTKTVRSHFLQAAKANGFSVTGYYFASRVEDCLRRNAARSGPERVPDVAILATAKKLELPTLEEGFDRLFYVRLAEGDWVVEEWNDEV